jgi:hypothetical protein
MVRGLLEAAAYALFILGLGRAYLADERAGRVTVMFALARSLTYRNDVRERVEKGGLRRND